MNDKRTAVSDEIDALAQEIRRVDGENRLGAGALAEALQPFLTELQHRREAEAAYVSVREMKLSPGADGEPRSDFFVSIKVGDREVTPHMFRERFKSEYHVALYDWLLNGGDEPELMAFSENEWPARKLGPELAASPSSPASGARVKTGIYVASKVKHAEMWRDLRSFEKMPIISTWIDELYPDDMDGLWQRCISEASNAQAFLILRRPDEVLKGAWIELGAALASGVPVYAVGIEEYTVAKDKRIRHFPNLVEARAAIRSALGEHP